MPKPANTICKQCPDNFRLIKQQTREIESLSALCVNQKTMLAKYQQPGPLAKALVKQYSDDYIDVLMSEIIRLKGSKVRI